MTKWKRVMLNMTVGVVFPNFLKAQGLANEMKGLHIVLDQLYNEMMPLCDQLIGVGQGIAGFAAMWYISSRVWRHLASAEPIDFYPLLRPFAIGLCIMIFPSVLASINGIMMPIVNATASMVEGSDRSIAFLLKQKEEAIRKTVTWNMYVGASGSGDRERWYKYTYESDPQEEGIIESIGNDIKFAMAKASYNFRNSIKEWMSEILRVIFESAALCINTLRTFQLIVLAILGPLVFGFAVFDGFQHTITVWIARYINIFLWLPVANIFGSIIGKIQEKMLELDIAQVSNFGDTFFSSTDTAYLVFMIIGIVGYFTVPSIANYIVHASGGSAFAHKVTNLFSNSSRNAVNSTFSTGGMIADSFGSSSGKMSQNMTAYNTTSPYFHEKPNQSSGYMGDRLKGN